MVLETIFDYFWPFAIV